MIMIYKRATLADESMDNMIINLLLNRILTITVEYVNFKCLIQYNLIFKIFPRISNQNKYYLMCQEGV